MTIRTLKNKIRDIDSLSELNELDSFIKSMKVHLGKTTLGIGMEVWVVQKTKRTAGIIKKMNIKKAVVDMNGMSYRVPFSMLEAK